MKNPVSVLKASITKNLLYNLHMHAGVMHKVLWVHNERSLNQLEFFGETPWRRWQT